MYYMYTDGEARRKVLDLQPQVLLHGSCGLYLDPLEEQASLITAELFLHSISHTPNHPSFEVGSM